jgi:hypothetical protein
MVHNKVKGTCGSLIGTLNEGWSACTKGGRMKAIAMAVANEMCGSLLWPEGSWATGFAFESLFWIARRWDNPLSCDLCLSHETYRCLSWLWPLPRS